LLNIGADLSLDVAEAGLVLIKLRLRLFGVSPQLRFFKDRDIELAGGIPGAM
jgi:hypothetical protein